jgi:hypothetical protein
VDATRAWRLWEETVATDPSAADLYLTTVWLDLATAAVTAVLSPRLLGAPPAAEARLLGRNIMEG